jgi:glycosyltransferase involved in cell wall biosynthesis
MWKTMPSMPLVSVIVPVYNTPYSCLVRCLDSISNQTLYNIEIICVNDGSTDNSLDILNKYKEQDARIKVISHDDNKGQAFARNLGIMEARGEYIGFVDSDDAIEKDYYRVLYEKARKHDADIVSNKQLMVWFNPTFYMEEGNWPKRAPLEKSFVDDIATKLSMVYANSNTSACKHIFKTSFIRDNNIEFLYGYYHEDQYFVFKSFYYANMIVTEEKVSPSYLYYIHENSSMNKTVDDRKYFKTFLDQFIVMDRIMDFLSDKNAAQELLESLYDDFCLIICQRLAWIDKKYLVKYLNNGIALFEGHPKIQKMLLKKRLFVLTKTTKNISKLKKHFENLIDLLRGCQ